MALDSALETSCKHTIGRASYLTCKIAEINCRQTQKRKDLITKNWWKDPEIKLKSVYFDTNKKFRARYSTNSVWKNDRKVKLPKSAL